jgi:anhydro-N-acetylmuramic acid kinase
MPELYIGLMSGTSMDAVDGALVDLASAPRIIATASEPLNPELRAQLQGIGRGTDHPLEQLGRLDVRVGRLFAATAKRLLSETGIGREAVRAIGSHGQTLHHSPYGAEPFTLQIGDPNLIAEATGLTTVADFRRRDIAAGGQGAPLVPAFHSAVFRSPCEDRAIVNIGGMANITLLPADPAAAVSGFDTGPGNALMDAWATAHLGAPMDAEGRWAASGRVHQKLLSRLLADEYFARPAPKSTGRERFNRAWLAAALQEAEELRPQDVQATLCELTALSIAHAAAGSPPPARVLVCGGGVLNCALMDRLDALLPCPVESTAAHGLDPRWVEAAAFAWLAQQTLRGRAGNLLAVTGARHPVVLGGIWTGPEPRP